MMAAAHLLLEDLPQFAEGLWLTLQLVVLALLLGGALALPLAVLRCSGLRACSAGVWLYTYFMRSTPLLLQLLAIYYGLGQLEWMQERWADDSAFWLLFRDPYFCAVLALSLNTCAYTTEMLAGAMRNTAPGEVEAAQALGMSRLQLLHRIALPGALRRCLPAYSNEVILMLQGSAIASAVTLLDLTGAARALNARYYAPFEAFIFAGLIYFLLTLAVDWLFHLAEKKWLAHLPSGRA